jgi:RNA polymerase sigma-70 factor (ECF subfamily)
MHARRARFEMQVIPHLDAAHRFARWLTRSATDADDLLQEAMLRAYRGFDALRGEQVRAWLLAIVRNCHASRRAQERRLASVPLPREDDTAWSAALIASTDDPERATIQRDEARTLERVIADLSEEHREVLVLREIEELSYREIAAVTHLPLGTVMSRLARARDEMRQRWFEQAGKDAHALR